VYYATRTRRGEWRVLAEEGHQLSCFITHRAMRTLMELRQRHVIHFSRYYISFYMKKILFVVDACTNEWLSDVDLLYCTAVSHSAVFFLSVNNKWED